MGFIKKPEKNKTGESGCFCWNYVVKNVIKCTDLLGMQLYDGFCQPSI
jgi:hypothetical protein